MEGSLRKLLVLGIYIITATHHTAYNYDHHEYVLIKTKMSWEEAQNYCRAEYSDLATVHNWNDMDRIELLAKDLAKAFWIGLYNDVNGWKWSLVDQSYDTAGTVYRNWQEGQPDNTLAAEHCVSMTKDGFWKDNRCWSIKLPLICFRDDAEDQYVLVTEEKSWYQAQTYCRQHHTDLVSVRGPAENRELSRRLQANQTVQEAWIGLHRDTWMWSDGSRYSLRHWGLNQPDNHDNSEACVTMFRGQWNDWKCGGNHSFLCQKRTVIPSSPEDPATIRQAVQRKTTVKMRLLSDSDLADPTLRQEVIQQFEAAVRLQGFTDVELVWRTLKKEPQPMESRNHSQQNVPVDRK